MLAGGSTGGDDGAVEAGLSDNVDLDGGVTTRVVDGASVDLGDSHPDSGYQLAASFLEIQGEVRGGAAMSAMSHGTRSASIPSGHVHGSQLAIYGSNGPNSRKTNPLRRKNTIVASHLALERHGGAEQDQAKQMECTHFAVDSINWFNEAENSNR